ARRNAAAGSAKITGPDSRRKPRESPQLRTVLRLDSYAEAIRAGRFAMTPKREKPADSAPAMSSSDYDAAVAAFIRNNGVTRCPTACLVRTQASVPEAERERSRRENLTAAARWPGIGLRLSDAC